MKKYCLLRHETSGNILKNQETALNTVFKIEMEIAKPITKQQINQSVLFIAKTDITPQVANSKEEKTLRRETQHCRL